MFRSFSVTCAALLALSPAALGATFTYTSAPLTVINLGGIAGAKRITIVFGAKAAPAAGACVMTQALKNYHDGADTRANLKAKGYIVIKNVTQDGGIERQVPVTYAMVCLGADGKTVAGNYQLYASAGTNLFLVSNQQTGGTDLAQFDIYFGGQIPQIYSNASTKPGTWTITP